MPLEVTDPMGGRIIARWGFLSDGVTAVIEMAAASGLSLVPPQERNPLLATTYGTGELIRYALGKGCRKFIIGIGGSATNDGGAGMAQALGVNLLDAKGRPIARGGVALADLDKIDITTMDPRLADCDVLLACDVTNPLCGPQGASCVYGPQKGASAEMVASLMRHWLTMPRLLKGTSILTLKMFLELGQPGGWELDSLFFSRLRCYLVWILLSKPPVLSST